MRRLLNVFGWISIIIAGIFLVLGLLTLNFLVIPFVLAFWGLATVFWGIRDKSRPVKVQPKVEPVYQKPKHKINGALKNPDSVATEYEFRPVFSLNEDTGEIVETQVKHRKLPHFDEKKTVVFK